ncbi:psychosine receptor-like [Pygocentrus nattereri]|uniref:psychosine receptor-like n=1 Tax=Pygocentrus nattereri TaxID=42514 RepID=UPI00081465D2|nr:psychosine receptor-like [Pygocentrus nattereri]
MNSTPAALNSTTNLTNIDCHPDFNLNTYFFILHLIIILIGIPCNAFSLFVSYQHIKQENELGVYLFNLALSDFFFIAGLPIWMDFELKDHWHHGKTLCTVCIFFLFTNFYSSALLLSCISVDRYFAVVYPLSFPFLRKPSTAATVSVAVWTFTLMFNAISIDPNQIYDDQFKICLDVFPISSKQIKVYVVSFFVGFLLPAVVVMFCYWRICREVRTNQATGLSERRRVFRLLGSVLLSLCLCFGPVHITMVLRAGLENVDTCPPAWLYFLYKAGVALAMLNCLADPLLYCFITRRGRTSVTQAFVFCKRKEYFKKRSTDI